MFAEPLGQHFGIHRRMPDQKRGAVAGRECRLRLFHTVFGTGHAGGISADEMVHGLLGSQAADRRNHTRKASHVRKMMLRG